MRETGMVVVCILMMVALLVLKSTIGDLEKKQEQTHQAWVATMSVLTDIANIPQENQPRIEFVNPDENGCAVIGMMFYEHGFDFPLSRQFTICPGGEVEIWQSFQKSKNEHRGDDPYWANLGKPEKERQQ